MVPTNASPNRVHVDTRIGAPFRCASLSLTAVKSSSCAGSRIAACVISSLFASATETAKYGKPCMKFRLPSIESTIQRYGDSGLPAFISPESPVRIACSGNAAEIVATIALSASESAAATMSPCSLENVGSRRKSRDASMMTLAARRAARTATARIGSEVVFMAPESRDLHAKHHAAVFMLEIVAMENVYLRTGKWHRKADRDANAFAGPDEHSVFAA